jgi:hypothetical protein
MDNAVIPECLTFVIPEGFYRGSRISASQKLDSRPEPSRE